MDRCGTCDPDRNRRGGIAPLRTPYVQGAAAQSWIATYLGEDVPVITRRSAEKCLYAQPGDILIDDWEKYRHLWVAKGGVWITQRSAAETLAALAEIGL